MTKAETKFDMVHDSGEIYRVLLDCMARPGKINRIADGIKAIENVGSFSPSLLGIAYTLVDREVNFHLLAEKKERAVQHIQWKTFSKHTDLHSADYVFIEKRLEPESIDKVMGEVRHGTLEDPHSSATLIIEVDSLDAHSEKGLKIVMEGPGIQHKREVCVDGFSAHWIKERKKVNSEFPLGIDMILTTRTGEIIAIPRTTIFMESEGI